MAEIRGRQFPDIAADVGELIGGTPLVLINRTVAGCHATIVGKLESANPGGSVKDRIGLAMILDAEERGKIKPDAQIADHQRHHDRPATQPRQTAKRAPDNPDQHMPDRPGTARHADGYAGSRFSG